MFEETRSLLKNHGGLLAAGFLLFFFSVFGQSVFFGAYLPQIQGALGLSKSGIGAIYAAATIASGIAIVFTGKGLDKYRLRNFLAVTLIGLAGGCFMLAGAATWWMLLVAFFMLRQFGQGLMVHSANTAINRYLESGRGKGVAFISQGGLLHVMVFPPLALFLAQYVDWRTAWASYGVFILAVLLPGFWFYMRRHQSTTHERWLRQQEAAQKEATQAAEKEWTRSHVLRDWRFYALAMLFFIAPFVGTALFFYQHDIADSLGISAMVYASTFPVLTATSVVAMFATGAVIDKYGEKPILTVFPILYSIGLYAAMAGGPLWTLYFGMAFVGLGNGMISTAGGPMIVHLYGTKHLGAVKALLFSVSIISSALSPVLFGFLMDAGYDITTTLSWVVYYTGTVWLVAFPVFATLKDQTGQKTEATP
jgi:MFS family permease